MQLLRLFATMVPEPRVVPLFVTWNGTAICEGGPELGIAFATRDHNIQVLVDGESKPIHPTRNLGRTAEQIVRWINGSDDYFAIRCSAHKDFKSNMAALKKDTVTGTYQLVTEMFYNLKSEPKFDALGRERTIIFPKGVLQIDWLFAFPDGGLFANSRGRSWYVRGDKIFEEAYDKEIRYIWRPRFAITFNGHMLDLDHRNEHDMPVPYGAYVRNALGLTPSLKFADHIEELYYGNPVSYRSDHIYWGKPSADDQWSVRIVEPPDKPDIHDFVFCFNISMQGAAHVLPSYVTNKFTDKLGPLNLLEKIKELHFLIATAYTITIWKVDTVNRTAAIMGVLQIVPSPITYVSVDKKVEYLFFAWNNVYYRYKLSSLTRFL